MKENQLQVYTNGLWLKTSKEKLLQWKDVLTDILKFYGYKLLLCMPLKESYHLSFKKGNEPLMVNCFKNGQIQMSTVEVPTMVELIIPHLERKLQVKFDFPADVKFLYTPYFADYLRARGMLKAPRYIAYKTLDDNSINNNEVEEEVKTRRKSSEDIHFNNSNECQTILDVYKDVRRRRRSEAPRTVSKTIDEEIEEVKVKGRRNSEGAQVCTSKKKSKCVEGSSEKDKQKVGEMSRSLTSFDRVNFNNNVIKLQDELGEARVRLTKTEGDLFSIRKELGHLTKDVTELKQKNRKYLQDNFTHDYKYWYGYQQYLDAKKKLAAKKTEGKVGWKI